MCEHEHAIHEITGLEERLRELAAQFAALDVQARIDRAVSEVIAASKKTAQAIIDSLEQRSRELYIRQADQDNETYEFAMRIADELANVATGIRRRDEAT